MTSGGMLTDTNRIEAFSDGVFAIAITLLVLDLPTADTGDVLTEVRADWISFVAYLVSFVTIASNWASHHAFFSRVRRADATILVANLLVLLGASVVPWPTALVANAIRAGSDDDQVVAIAIYAGTSLLVTAAWIVLTRTAARRPDLLLARTDQAMLTRQAQWISLTPVPVLAAAGVAFVAPRASLIIFVILPLLYLGSIFRSGLGDPDA